MFLVEYEIETDVVFACANGFYIGKNSSSSSSISKHTNFQQRCVFFRIESCARAKRVFGYLRITRQARTMKSRELSSNESENKQQAAVEKSFVVDDDHFCGSFGF